MIFSELKDARFDSRELTRSEKCRVHILIIEIVQAYCMTLNLETKDKKGFGVCGLLDYVVELPKYATFCL